MDWSAYAAFIGLATLLVLVPGADFTVVTRNALIGGRRGWWSAVGVTSSNLVQGAAAAAGLAAVIVRIEPLFQAIRWAGIAYLAWLAVQALRSAIRGEYTAAPDPRASSGQAFAGWRQGFLSNITNPKVLVFYLVVGVHRARRRLARRRVRRSLDAATGVALLGFSARLALD